MAKILARVTSRAVEGPRGPDVVHRVKVPPEWLVAGEVIELDLPRNLTCAACGGGGCDTCGRSGAITLRERDEPPEVVEVRLPTRLGADSEVPKGHGFTLRIPEHGGLPEPGSHVPRGLLLLTFLPNNNADQSVRLVQAPHLLARMGNQARGIVLQQRNRSSIVAAVLVIATLLAIWIWFGR